MQLIEAIVISGIISRIQMTPTPYLLWVTRSYYWTAVLLEKYSVECTYPWELTRRITNGRIRKHLRCLLLSTGYMIKRSTCQTKKNKIWQLVRILNYLIYIREWVEVRSGIRMRETCWMFALIHKWSLKSFVAQFPALCPAMFISFKFPQLSR